MWAGVRDVRHRGLYQGETALKFFREFRFDDDGEWRETGVLAVKGEFTGEMATRSGIVVESSCHDYWVGRLTYVMDARYAHWRYEEVVGEETALYEVLALGVKET